MKIALMPNSEKERSIENAQRIIDILSEYGTSFSMHIEFSKEFSSDNC